MRRLRLSNVIWVVLISLSAVGVAVAGAGGIFKGRNRVERVDVARVAASKPVYNLSVDGNENYFVSHSSVLVHNCASVNPEVEAAVQRMLADPRKEAVIPAGVDKTGLIRRLEQEAERLDAEISLGKVVPPKGIPREISPVKEAYHIIRVGTKKGVFSPSSEKLIWHWHPKPWLPWPLSLNPAKLSLGDMELLYGKGQISSLVSTPGSPVGRYFYRARWLFRHLVLPPNSTP